MYTLLEAIGIVLETYFGFGFLNAYAIGDTLKEAKGARYLFGAEIFRCREGRKVGMSFLHGCRYLAAKELSG